MKRTTESKLRMGATAYSRTGNGRSDTMIRWSMPTIEFWFDYISPFAYLAWQRVHAAAERNGHEVIYRPVLFAGLLNHWGQLGPAEIPPKRLHAFKQVSRRAHALGVPLAPPPSHPFNPLLALRLTCAEQPAAQRRTLIDVLFRASWGGGPGVTDPAVVATLLRDAGLDATALLAAAQSQACKQLLIDNGQQAIERGLVGVPTMLVKKELFWGDDSFDDLEAYLRGEDKLDHEGLRRWAQLPASANRRG